MTVCAAKFAANLGIQSEPEPLSYRTRSSSVLILFTTAGLVRQSGQFDGRRFCGRSPLRLSGSGLSARCCASNQTDSVTSGETVPGQGLELMTAIAHVSAILAPRELGGVTVGVFQGNMQLLYNPAFH